MALEKTLVRILLMQAILGHSNSETTLRYYSQVDPYHYRQVTKAVENRRLRQSQRGKGNRKKYVSGTYESIQDN